jgi:hypothetical protein
MPQILSASQLVQLYAPIAGLLVLAFWVGGLSQRVKQLEKESIGDDLRAKVIRLEVQMESAAATLEKVDRSLQGIHRQLANIASRKSASLGDILSAD